MQINNCSFIYIYTQRISYTVNMCKWTGYHQIQALLRVLTSDYVIYNARQFQSIATYRLSITVNEANVYTPLAAQLIYS